MKEIYFTNIQKKMNCFKKISDYKRLKPNTNV